MTDEGPGQCPALPNAGHGGAHRQSLHLEAEGSEVQGHPRLHSKFQANLGYMKTVPYIYRLQARINYTLSI